MESEATKPTAIIQGLEFHAKALAPVAGETDDVQFFVGSSSPNQENNQVLLVKFDEDSEQISTTSYQHHKGEIKCMACPAWKKELLATVHDEVTIWTVPDETSKELSEMLTLPDQDVKSICWHPTEEQVMSLSQRSFKVWDINNSSSAKKEITTEEDIHGCHWNPHHNCAYVATLRGSNVVGYDLRESKENFEIVKAHSGKVRSLDFNPNKQYHMVTGGDDGRLRFWDWRNTDTPLMTFSMHSHWVWSARYNHFHDQLILSSGSDFKVVLSNAASLSSDLYGELDNEEEMGEERKQPIPDGQIAVYDEHEDSVYAVEWSAGDPWTFASLSYDGRLVINRVPQETKYHILL
eukprot:m.71816 g.71816  ORF g.71816 m.71816 type:complete len:350 (+) comp12279_c0_seq1:165-1214(+)